MLGFWITLSVLVVAVSGLIVYATSRYVRVGPNEVLIISGRRGTYRSPDSDEAVVKNFRIYHGGGTFVLPIREKVDRMSVELMTLEIRTPEFFTKFGIPIVADCIAQIKVMSDDPVSIATAAEMFLSKSEQEMNRIAHQMMQGHLRAVISTLPFEEIHANPEAFAQTVQRLTAMDLANMGIQVVSFTIREVKDPSGYLTALGRPQVAQVKKEAVLGEARAQRDATSGQAEATREAAIASAEAQRASEQAKISSELAIATSRSAKEVSLQELAAKEARARAAADIAHELESTKQRQLLVQEALEVSHIERKAQIGVEDLEAERKGRELEHTVRRPAEAERYRIETLAAAERERVRLVSEAEAEKRRLEGQSDADVIRARGEAEAEAIRQKALAEAEGLKARYLAEAEGMRQKADAYRSYNAAAVTQMIIDRLPEIAQAIAAPLQSIDRISIVQTGAEGKGSGVSRVTEGVTSVLAQLPPVVETMTGIRLESLLREVPGLGSNGRGELASEPTPERA